MTEENQENKNLQDNQSQQAPPIPQQSGPIYGGQPQQGQANYGQQQFQNHGGMPPQSYMVMNIIATVLGLLACGNCCISLILGIVGIVFSAQVNNKFMMGDVHGANSSASTAKILGIISLVLSGLTILANIVFLIVGGMETYMEMIDELSRQH